MLVWKDCLLILTFFSLQFFSIIVFGCISSSGWFFMQNLGQEVCVLNMDSSACHFSTMVGIVAFLASIGFLVGEWYDSHFFLFHSLIFQKSREIAARQFLFSKFWRFSVNANGTPYFYSLSFFKNEYFTYYFQKISWNSYETIFYFPNIYQFFTGLYNLKRQFKSHLRQIVVDQFFSHQ